MRLGAFLHGFGRRLGALALPSSVVARGSIRQRGTVRRDSWMIQVHLGIDVVTGRKRYRSEALRGRLGLRFQAQEGFRGGRGADLETGKDRRRSEAFALRRGVV